MKHRSTRFDKFSFENPKSSTQDDFTMEVDGQNTTPLQQLKTLLEKQKQQESIIKKLFDTRSKYFFLLI